MMDNGLLGAMLNISSDILINPSKLFAEYNGALVENYIAMEFTNMGFSPLYYWTSEGVAEVDFLIQYKDEIHPIEVKSGTNRNLKSLRSYQTKYQPTMLFRISPRNYHKSEQFVNLPLYSAFTLLSIIDNEKS